jgi:hypothetical protein
MGSSFPADGREEHPDYAESKQARERRNALVRRDFTVFD